MVGTMTKIHWAAFAFSVLDPREPLIVPTSVGYSQPTERRKFGVWVVQVKASWGTATTRFGTFYAAVDPNQRQRKDGHFPVPTSAGPWALRGVVYEVRHRMRGAVTLVDAPCFKTFHGGPEHFAGCPAQLFAGRDTIGWAPNAHDFEWVRPMNLYLRKGMFLDPPN